MPPRPIASRRDLPARGLTRPLAVGASAPRTAMASAVALLLVLQVGCASSGATPRPFPTPGQSSSPSHVSPRVAELLATALSLRGVPYRPGGADPSGFDCSGFVRYVFGRHGLTVPRTVPEQYRSGRRVDARSIAAGDLVFFRTSGRGPSHVGIAISAEQFVHAPSSTGVVRTEPLSSRYWEGRFVGARRVH